MARRRVRLALRNARHAKGLSQGQVAGAMEWSLSKVMRIESGEVTISPIDLRALLAQLGVTDTDEVQRLVDDAKLSRRRQMWWSTPQYRDHLTPALRKLIQFEVEASTIRQFHIMLVPGLLQTDDYARAVLQEYGTELLKRSVDVIFEARTRRQNDFFARRPEPRFLVLLDEGVLHRVVGGPDVMVGQLDELLRMQDRHPVTVRIIPFSAAAPIALLGPFTILDVGSEGDALLYRESHIVDEAEEDPERLRRHRRIFDDLWRRALDDASSIDLIKSHVKALRTRRRRTP